MNLSWICHGVWGWHETAIIYFLILILDKCLSKSSFNYWQLIFLQFALLQLDITYSKTHLQKYVVFRWSFHPFLFLLLVVKNLIEFHQSRCIFRSFVHFESIFQKSRTLTENNDLKFWKLLGFIDRYHFFCLYIEP